MPFNILVLNQLKENHMAAIQDAAPGSSIITADLSTAGQHIANTDILVAWGNQDIRQLYTAAPQLRWVHALSAGVEDWLFPELVNSSTLLTNSKGIHGIPISEHVLALMLAFTRGLNLLIPQQHHKQWKRVRVDEIHEKTIGIVGLGNIGREIAKKAKALGMHVVATKREATTELFVDALYTPDYLTKMLSICDFVVMSLPLTEETNGMFNLDYFSAMKRTAYFINIARGGVIVEADLITALEQQLIQGAGLDVFAQEPLPDTSPLWNMPNVIITPHLAGLSPSYLDRAIQLFADDLTRFIDNDQILNIVDKQKGY
ncbi:D-2-hydroxyacid dehydrogenase [Propionispora vibrioides]|uniref:Phosphoglycerate dehydrogenase n=1 Tax=Propionispora vibrioides TaxID=112903 RepID=A0A1H8TA46_9FIRM|nr:Phosphoglycerate dehydrogenase [Propionispora vibrioides]